MIIRSEVTLLPPRLPDFSETEIKNEPMLFNCDMKHAQKFGGKITHAFLDALPLDWRDRPIVFDSRVHMLMPGWYPCIPGWHHDDVPRTRKDGQPNYGDGQDRSFHCMALVNGDACPTIFALGTSHFEIPEEGQTVYKVWHGAVEKGLADKALISYTLPTNQLVLFNDRTWHRGSSATANCWRWFGRISCYLDKDGNEIARRNRRTNEIRRQVQVYMSDANAGW